MYSLLGWIIGCLSFNSENIFCSRSEEQLAVERRERRISWGNGQWLRPGPLSGPPLTATSMGALNSSWAPSRAASSSRGFQGGTPTPQTQATRVPLLQPMPACPQHTELRIARIGTFCINTYPGEKKKAKYRDNIPWQFIHQLNFFLLEMKDLLLLNTLFIGILFELLYVSELVLLFLILNWAFGGKSST